jgi:hypothetical protein
VYIDTSAKAYSTFSIVRDTPSEAEEILHLIKNQDGVSNVRMDLLRAIFHVHDWLDEAIEDRLKEI